MITQRTFKTAGASSEMFSNCLASLDDLKVIVTKKEVLKKEGDDFDGVIEGNRTTSEGNTIIRLKLHGFRKKGHPLVAGIVTEIEIETFELSKNNNEPCDTTDSNDLNEEFNERIDHYAWQQSGG
jgi:hypothetical protein